MSVTLIDTDLILVTVRYVKALKPGGPLSYYRRIPRDLTRHYGGLSFIRRSLGCELQCPEAKIHRSPGEKA